mmetsp:Transcript_40544/g.134173  ORF Transcript_40544/g.134173 Transcript_40544/m.134173 type:complete len:91 (+) Transcript_40544:652-924(+)
MSQGQSVSLEASLWRSLRPPYEVHGNHVHLAEVWERRLGTLNKGSPAEAPRHRVHTVAVEKPAIYLRTLSSRASLSRSGWRGSARRRRRP